jgi:SAM-dependent methyltransferase
VGTRARQDVDLNRTLVELRASGWHDGESPRLKPEPIQLSPILGLVPMSEDGSNGYEGIASIYVARRGTRPLVGDAIGAATVRAWAQAFPRGATVLDLGSGPGEPSTRILQEAGLASYAVDASSAMVAAFRERFPGVPATNFRYAVGSLDGPGGWTS